MVTGPIVDDVSPTDDLVGMTYVYGRRRNAKFHRHLARRSVAGTARRPGQAREVTMLCGWVGPAVDCPENEVVGLDAKLRRIIRKNCPSCAKIAQTL